MYFSETDPAFIRLRDTYAESRRDIVFWVGAGLSIPADLPTWAQLRDSMLGEAVEKLTSYPPAEADLIEDRIERARKSDDFWSSFQEIRDILGDARYQASIRHIFSSADSKDIPYLYKRIWEMNGVRGVITLNIDNFATRAHRNVRHNEDNIASFCGVEAGDYTHIIKNSKTFIANLHGVHERHNSWIFTKSDFNRLSGNKAYKTFIETVFNCSCVVFLGISANDIAAGGFLEHLTKIGVGLDQHFWITDRVDHHARNWADKSSVQIIRYNPGGTGNHTEAIDSVLSTIERYVSYDVKSKPVIPSINILNSLPDPRELLSKDVDDLRGMLSGHAKWILQKNNNDTQCIDYKDFLRKYARCIHQAWYVTQDEPNNKFYNLNIIKKITSGPFSSIWKLIDDQGDYYALKIIQMDNLERGVPLDSFRRGVESLNYLTDADVPGTAKIHFAYEMPTAVVMDYVDGDSLSKIATTSAYKFWTDGIEIMIGVSKHLNYSHNLPQGVLHRDVRPSNIMVPYFYWDEHTASNEGLNRYHSVLLNYDMSWHAKATGSTITGNMSEGGFYAPEQLSMSDQPVSRNTKVDSYGLAMSIFYAYTGTTPPPGGSRSTEWETIMKSRFRPDKSLKLHSAPVLIRRVIENATRQNSNDRISVREILYTLESIKDALNGDFNNMSPEVMAEEVAARTLSMEYVAIEGKLCEEIKQGRKIQIWGELQSNSVRVDFTNTATEHVDRGAFARIWKEKLRSSIEILKSGGWEVHDETTLGLGQLRIRSSMKIGQIAANLSKCIDTLHRGLAKAKID